MRRIDVSVALLALIGCSSQSGVVGGECRTGYEPCGHACCLAPTSQNPNGNNNLQSDAGTPQDDGGMPDGDVDGSQNDGGTGDGGSDSGDGGIGDGGSSDGSVCMPPNIVCGNQCLDPLTDPNNCGQCGKVCPSNQCVSGACTGSAPGHVVTIGHDYSTAPQKGSAQARVVVNAMLLPLSNPVRVMSFEHYSDSNAVTNVETLVQAAAKLLGRSVTFTQIVTDSQVSQTLDITTYDVLFIADQVNSNQGDLGILGAQWQKDGAIATFLKAGGVVVVLDGASGTGEMPDFLTKSSLLQVMSHTQIGGALTVSAPNDAIGAGVVSPYVPTSNTITMSTENNGGNVTYVVEKAMAPAVVHKVFP